MSYDPDVVEGQVKQEWKQDGTRRKALKANKGGEKFFFLDGPPYATGSIHMGTGMNKILKDFYVRFHRMLGYHVHAQPGYDVHGLPIENKVEEEEGFTAKQDIEDFGVENFVKKCRAFVDGHIEEMNRDFNDMGVWMDWENPYITYHNYYIEGAWHTFKRAYEQDYLYKGKYPVHICTRCETAVAYNEIEYTTLEDPQVFVAFPVRDSDEELLIWTTTPWTLPANVAIMVHPEFEYALVEFDGRRAWMAEELVEGLMERFEVEEYEIVETRKGSELEGVEYNHPLAEEIPAQDEVQGRVVLSERYVDLSAGTGLVHSAPGHGREDYQVGQREELPILSPVDLKGEFTEEAGDYAGQYVKDADDHIKRDLDSKNALIYTGRLSHEYPKCWRCDTPLLQVAIPQWFFGATRFRRELLEANEEVNWVPSWAGQKFHEWLEQLGDWPVSRQRYWGIPLPIWECSSCDATRVIGDTDELPEVPDDLHRPYIDDVELECGECGGTMERIPDVLDVWFDSGVAPWASLRSPEVDFSFEEDGPVDLELEGFDQFRGWWNSQFISCMMTYGNRPFSNVVYHGKVMLEGKEMSKSKGIVVSPGEAIEKYGRDILRFYILSKDPSDDWSFRWDEMDENLEFMNILWNLYQYRDAYVGSPERPDGLELEDGWILSRLNSTVRKVREASTSFEAYRAARAVENFTLNDLSRGYVKMIRDRLRPGYSGDDRQAAEWTLRRVTDRLLNVLAPFVPYITEHLHEGRESLHLQELPEVEEERINDELERYMDIFQQVEKASATLRQREGVKLRHPVRSVTVTGGGGVKEAVEMFRELLCDRLNVKEVVYEKAELNNEVKLDYAKAGPELGADVPEVESALAEEDHDALADRIDAGESVELAGHELGPELFEVRTHADEEQEGEEFTGGVVYMDTEMDDDLLDEAFASEVIRAVQQARKEAGLDVGDEVALGFEGDVGPLREFEDELRRRVNVRDLAFSGGEFEHAGEVSFEGREVRFGFSGP